MESRFVRGGLSHRRCFVIFVCLGSCSIDASLGESGTWNFVADQSRWYFSFSFKSLVDLSCGLSRASDLHAGAVGLSDHSNSANFDFSMGDQIHPSITGFIYDRLYSVATFLMGLRPRSGRSADGSQNLYEIIVWVFSYLLF